VFTIIVASCTISAFCCNPFNESGRNNVRNNLSNIHPWMTGKLPQLNSDYKVCDKCHHKYVASNEQKNDDGDSDEIE
jgi:hypothetical protein